MFKFTVRAGCIEVTAPARSNSDLALKLHDKYGFTQFWFTPPSPTKWPEHKRGDEPHMVIANGVEVV